MALNQESAGAAAAAAPLDVDPYWISNNEGVLLGRSQQDPLDHLHIEAYSIDERSSNFSSTETTSQLSEAEAAAQEFQTRVGQNYLPLYHAASRGDWKSAITFIGRDTNLWTSRITSAGQTVLIVAARACQWHFVLKLIQILPPEALSMNNTYGTTVLHYVALRGNIKIAKALVRKNNALTQIIDKQGATPLLASTQRPGNKEMIWYLISVTREECPSPSCPFTGTMSGKLIFLLTAAGYNDITLYLVRRYPALAIAAYEDGAEHLLKWLSRNPWLFLSGSKLTFWERWIYKFVHVETEYAILAPTTTESSSGFIAQVLHWFKIFLRNATAKLEQVRDAKLQHICATELVKYTCELLVSSINFQQVRVYLNHVMYAATCLGNVEILRICLHHFPDLIIEPIYDNGRTILHVAVECRQHKIFNLTNEMSSICQALARINVESGNTIWHLAAKLAPSTQLLSVSGAALQMQRELQWFKGRDRRRWWCNLVKQRFTEVEKLVHPADKYVSNAYGDTADEVFRVAHKDLAELGEKWMKDTANSCMIVATLIATVMFAAAFTVPGGNISDKGIPIFLENNVFMVFAISDALALFSSSTSLLMFLAILTARYEPKDFLLALPRRLIIGLGSLFLSIITMMVAFGATLFIVVGERWQWMYIPIILLASVPVTTFGMLQLPLFIQMIQSTYGSGIFLKSGW